MANVDEAPDVEIDRDPAVPPLTEEHLQALRQTIQGARLRAFWKVEIDMGGQWQDLTDRFDPYLISVTVIDRIMGWDSAKIELDDRDGKLGIPGDQAQVQISFGWQNEGFYRVFDGYVQDVESGFSRRGGGRRLWIDCEGTDLTDRIKDLQYWSLGEGAPPGELEGTPIALTEVWPQVAGLIGFGGLISPEVGDKVKRDYWYLYNESVMHWLTRLAGETGLGFKLGPGQAVIFDPQQSRNYLGQAMAEILAEWGINLLIWRIKPKVARPRASKSVTRWFNILKGQWEQQQGTVPGGGAFGNAKATAGLPAGAPNASVADQANDSLEWESLFNAGQGQVTINGEPRAKAGATITVWGARPGVDGRYEMEEVEHSFTRGGGYTTRIRVRRPFDTQGVEEPKPGEGGDRAPAPAPVPAAPGGEVGGGGGGGGGGGF